MKNIIGVITFSVAIVMVGCAGEPAQTEVVVVPAQTETKMVVIEKEAPAASTTLTFDKKGVSLETKKEN